MPASGCLDAGQGRGRSLSLRRKDVGIWPAQAPALHRGPDYRELLAAQVPAQGIVLIGDSAGSNLLLGMLHRLKAAGDPLPCCLAVMSPVVELTPSSESLVENGARDCIFTLAAILAFRRLYATPDVFLDPAVSPLFGLVVDAADPTDVPAVRTASSRSISVLPA